MLRAIELASLGAGNVAPNPLVGAVVVHKDIIVGEGYHEKFGEAHAEVNAINAVANPDILSECTIYVSLEPCAHHGKTPPCADLIIDKQLKRVVIGCADSFAEVNGKGIQRLKAAGIDVAPFVLESRARELNKRFFTVQEKKRPFVILKWAETRNGLIDNKDGDKDAVTWISSPETQPFVHQLRAENDAILVGKITVVADNPSLTTRSVAGPNPLRIILDSGCELLSDRTVLSDGKPTIVLNTVKSENQDHVQFVQLENMEPATILNALYELKVQSVLIEGGASTLQSFLDADLWDEAYQIIGQSTFDTGTHAPKINGTLIAEESIFGDLIKLFRP